jgi:hypothetical protein
MMLIKPYYNKYHLINACLDFRKIKSPPRGSDMDIKICVYLYLSVVKNP